MPPAPSLARHTGPGQNGETPDGHDEDTAPKLPGVGVLCARPSVSAPWAPCFEAAGCTGVEGCLVISTDDPSLYESPLSTPGDTFLGTLVCGGRGCCRYLVTGAVPCGAASVVVLLKHTCAFIWV